MPSPLLLSYILLILLAQPLASALPKAGPDSPTSSLPASAGVDAPPVLHRTVGTLPSLRFCALPASSSLNSKIVSYHLCMARTGTKSTCTKSLSNKCMESKACTQAVQQTTCPTATAPWIIITTTFLQMWLLDLHNSCSYQLPFLELNFP